MAERSDSTDLKLFGFLRLRGLRSLQFKASLLIVLLILSVSFAGMSLSLHATRTALLENESRRTHEWAVSLAAGESTEVIERNREALLRAANNLVRMHGVAYVTFADREGKILASAESQLSLMPAFSDSSESGEARLLPYFLNEPRIIRNTTAGVTCMDVIVPVRQSVSRPQDRQAPGRLVGFLRFATDISDGEARLRGIATDLVCIAVGVMVLIVPCSLMATRRVVAPLNQLSRAAHALAQGTLSARAPVYSGDEIGELARTFNFMADQVSRTQGALLELNAELERRVAQRTRDLEEQAARDPLTSLYNRRHFGEVMTREFAAAERYGPDLTCLMFDVDHFKMINDRYGHRTGDRILIALAQAISAELRGSDVAARFGGDEFILLLPQTAAPQAATLADRIVNRFADKVTEAAPGVTATLSIGVASLRTTRARSSESLIHEADVALYAAKEGGRNRTMEAGGAA